MKRMCLAALLMVLGLACRKSTNAPAATTAAPQPAAAQSAAAPAGVLTPPAGAPGQPPAAPTVKPVPAKLPDILAKVDGDSVERWELEAAVQSLEARQGAKLPAEKRDEVMRGLLDQLVSYHVLAQEAHDRKIETPEPDVLARIVQMQSGFPDEQAFKQALTAQGLTRDQLLRQTRMGLTIGKVIDAEVPNDITIKDADVSTFYNQNLDHFKQPDSVRASHILIALPQNADEAAKTAARAKAQQILQQLKKGGKFDALAREQSQDGESAPRGGDLGFVAKGATHPALEAALFALKPGGVSGIVETPFGFHIVKAGERRAARTAPLTEVAPDIKQYLAGAERNARITAFVQKARAKRSIKLLV